MPKKNVPEANHGSRQSNRKTKYKIPAKEAKFQAENSKSQIYSEKGLAGRSDKKCQVRKPRTSPKVVVALNKVSSEPYLRPSKSKKVATRRFKPRQGESCGESSQGVRECSADELLTAAERKSVCKTPIEQGSSETIPEYNLLGSTPSRKPDSKVPMSIKLIKRLSFSEDPLTACYYNGTTYVGLVNKTVIAIDGNFNRSDPLLTFDNFPYAIVVHNDLIYTAVYGQPCYTFHVHDLTGKHITSWNHSDYRSYRNNFAIVNNQIVMADRENQEFIVYSLTGEIIGRLPCPILGRATVAVSGVDESSIVVSDRGNCQVFRLNIVTGDVVWLAKNIIWVESLTYHQSKVFALVDAKLKKKQIWVFDAQTGKKLKVLTDSHLLKIYNVSDMHAHDDMLVIPRCTQRDLMYYQLTF